MRTILIISLSFLFSETGFTQAKIIDSLSRAYQTADDKGKILLLSEIGYYYRIINPDSALLITHTALEMAKRAQFLQGEASALASIGAVHRIQGDMQKAMLYFFKALRIAQKYNFETEVAKIHLGIGVVYSDLKEFNLAIQNINIAARIYKKLDNKERYSTTLANLGEVYMRKKQLDSALIFLKKPLDYAQDIRSSAILPFSYSRLARVYLRLRDYDLAYTHAMKAIELGRQGNNTRVKCYTYQVLAEYHQSLNKIDSAIYYAENAFKVAKTYNYQWDILESINTLANLYESKDLKLALHYSKFSMALSDSLSGVDRINALQRKIIEEQEIVRKKEASNLAAQNQLRQNVLLGGLAILGLIGFILYRNNRQKQKANLILENTLLKLQATQTQLIQSEKLASLGELTAGIAHEIQNPLNFVNNFAEVSAEMLGEMKEEIKAGNTSEVIAIADDLEQNLSKINHHGKRASSIVKGMLEHSRTSTGVKEPTDLNALADEFLRLAYHGLRAKDNNFNAKIETHFDPDLPKVSVIPQDIGRVLLNLINNAFYAVAERSRSTVHQRTVETLHATSLQHPPYQPTVTVSTQKTDNHIILKVQDNGPGIPESIRDKIFQPFFTTKPTGQGTGLGLSLAYDIITKGHGGSLSVDSIEGEGSKFTISLPTLS